MTTILHQIVVDMVLKSSGGAMPGLAGGGGVSAAAGHLGGLTPQLHEAEGAASKLGETLRHVASGAVDAFTGAVEKVGRFATHLGVAAGAAGVGALTYGVIHLNRELESTNISLASIFQAQGFAGTFTGAMGMARDQVAKMKKDIQTLPGDLGNLTSTMSVLASPAGLAGADPDQMRQLAGKTMLASSILLGSRFGTQQSLDVGAREMAMILSGHAGGRNDLANVLPGIAGHAHDISSMTPEQRLAAVNKALDALTKDSAAAFGTSWTAVYTTLIDNFKYKLLAPTSAPLFEHIKADIIKINGWFAANDQRVGRFAQVLGDDLARAWDRGVATAEEWGPVVVNFAKDVRNELEVVWTRFGPSIEAAGGALKEAMQNGTALHEIEKVLKLYAEVKLGKGALSIGGGAFNALGGGGALSSLLGGGEAAGAGIGLAGAGVAASVLAVAALAAAGALHAAADSGSQYHDEAVRGLKDVTRSFDHLTDELELHVMPSLEAMGTKGLPIVSKLLDLEANIIGGQAAMFTNPQALFGDVLRLMGQGTPGQKKFFDMLADDISPKMTATPALESPNRDKVLDVRSLGPLAQAIESEKAASKRKQVPAGLGTTNIQKVEIVSTSNADPNRVAVILYKKVVDLSRHPKASPDVPDYSASR